MNKYRNTKVTIDGITFDSKKEAARYGELKLLEKAGAISALVLQPSFELQGAFVKNGKKHRAITYRGDFQYLENGRLVVEDVKGVCTKEFLLKKKMFDAKYPDLELRLI